MLALWGAVSWVWLRAEVELVFSFILLIEPDQV